MSQTVQRAIAILEYVSGRPRSLGEVADHLGVHRSTALRLLQTLTEGGLARRGPDGRYGVGYRLAGLAARAKDQFDLRTVAHPYLVALKDRWGHTVHLAALDGRNIVYVDKVESAGSVRLYSQIGKPVLLHTAGVSKAILAHLPRRHALALLEGYSYDAFTPTTITSREALLAELDRTAERGWASDDGEFESFINCIASPVRAETGAVVGAVSITALRAQADLVQLHDALPDLLATTTTISKELGWVPPPTGSTSPSTTSG
jgi:DNA-binding IclR family transcriptional regulator